MQCDMILISKQCFPNHCQEDDVYDGKDFEKEKKRMAVMPPGPLGHGRGIAGTVAGGMARGPGGPGNVGVGIAIG